MSEQCIVERNYRRVKGTESMNSKLEVGDTNS